MVEMEHAVVRWNSKDKKWLKPEVIDRPINWKCYESCHWIFPVTSEKWLIPTAFRLNWDGICPFGHKAFAFVSHPTWEAEHALWLEILEQARVNLTPGAACHVGEPGFFRLCYAGLPAETVEAAVRRIVKLLDGGATDHTLTIQQL